MTTSQPSGSAVLATPPADMKTEENMDDTQWATMIATSVIKQTKEKDEGTKVAVSNSFLGDHKDTQQFMLDIELYLWMNKMRYNTAKKKMFLLSYVREKALKWKEAELLELFKDEEVDNKGKVILKTEETWSVFQKRFEETWQPINTAGDAQLKIDDL
ncbi:hypothetical protein Moror_16720 [Moniliophthora roreri MCA 2997]|uniref:Reverse transcriptase-rnase h-integrase n=2 Tax=Moniliophthora roreri TaxID=221103 RepID=V2W3F2_MONRO|nr:hypothetical protein Moror_16720 [Moniliophthora roreri MCA 2997]